MDRKIKLDLMDLQDSDIETRALIGGISVRPPEIMSSLMATHKRPLPSPSSTQLISMVSQRGVPASPMMMSSGLMAWITKSMRRRQVRSVDLELPYRGLGIPCWKSLTSVNHQLGIWKLVQTWLPRIFQKYGYLGSYQVTKTILVTAKKTLRQT